MTEDVRLPLAGLRVVEFSHMVMGPACGLVLADLGAEVIKVEPPAKPNSPDKPGDPTRYLTNTGAGYFPAFNRNKKSVILDLESVDGRAMAKQLIATADVFIENFRPGGLEAKGFGYRDLVKDNPRLIYLSLKGFLSGPHEDRTALDEVVQMMSGMAFMTGPPGRPLRAGAPVNDMMGGVFGVVGVLAALRERDQSGKGKLVQAGLFETAAWLVSTHMMQFAVQGKPLQSMAAGSRAWGVYDVFDTADGIPLFIGVVTDRQWQLFTKALGAEALEAAPFQTNSQRAQSRGTLIPLVASILKSRSCAELERLCEDAGLPFSRVQSPADLFHDPHLAAGGMANITLPDGRATRVPSLPFSLGSWRAETRSDVPAAGMHTEAVLSPFRR